MIVLSVPLPASDNKLNVNDSLKVAKLELDVAGLWRGYKELTDTRLEPPMNIRNMFRSPEFVELLNKSVIERIDPMMEPVIEKVQSIEKQANRRVSQSDVLPQDSLAELNQQIRGLVMSAVEERLDRFSKSLNERLEEVLGERLRASVELNARLTFEKLMESELKTAISEQISVQTMKSVNLALKQRMKATSSMDLDETFLNNSIRAQIQSLIRDKNLDKNSKPDYASELNNAIVLDASSTYTGKREACLLFAFQSASRLTATNTREFNQHAFLPRLQNLMQSSCSGCPSGVCPVRRRTC